jgi:hypothetical protein
MRLNMTLKEMLACHESERLKLAIDLRDQNYSDNRAMGISRFNHILRTAGLKCTYDKDYKW